MFIAMPVDRDMAGKIRGIAAMRSTFAKLVIATSFLFGLCGCQTGSSLRTMATSHVLETNPFVPSHNRHWKPALAVLPYAEFDQHTITVHNVRNFYWFSEDVFLPRYYDKRFRLADVKTVDFIVVPFREAPHLAHTMLSFGLADGSHLVISVEARLEQNEDYSPLAGALGKFELMYVVADERDVIPLRTEHRHVDVYVYRTRVAPEQAQQLLVDMLHRVNQIKQQPEFYHTLYNNCTTNIVRHVNRIRPGRIPPSLAQLLTGHSDRLAYDLGLLDDRYSFEETRRLARINDRVPAALEAANFSEHIRR